MKPRFYNYIYLLFCTVALVQQSIIVTNELWRSDFFVYVGFIRQVLINPFSPISPLISDPLPGQVPYWPFLALIALVSQVLNADIATCLGYFSLLNLTLLCLTFWIFCDRLWSDPRKTVLAALFVTALWSWEPWSYSGFLNFRSLHLVAAYPSTLAFSISFLAFSLAVSKVRLRVSRQWMISLLVTSVLLIHPLTVVFTGVGLLAIDIVSRHDRLFSRLLIFFGPALIVGWFWPFFPFSSLFGMFPYASDESARLLYQDVFSHLGPALLGTVVLVFAILRRQVSALILMGATFGSIYILGWVYGKWNFGRAISFMCIAWQMALAEYVVTVCGVSKPFAFKWVISSVLAFTLVVYCLMIWGLRFVVFASLPKVSAEMESYRELLPLEKGLSVGSIILSEERLGILMPAIGAKPFLAHRHASFPDYTDRKRILDRFLSGNCESIIGQLGSLREQNISHIILPVGASTAICLKKSNPGGLVLIERTKNYFIWAFPSVPAQAEVQPGKKLTFLETPLVSIELDFACSLTSIPIPSFMST